MTRLGFAWMPRGASEAITLAQEIERGGFWGLGLSDSPVLYPDLYPIIGACLERTERIQVGSNVVNPVSRHWSVHSATARAFEELYPGRYHLGVGSGDGSVHSIGRSPAKLAELESSVQDMRDASPDGLPVFVAASGPRTAEVAGRVADGIIIGAGADAGAITQLGHRARAARREMGIDAPLELRAQIPLLLVEHGDDTEAARRSMSGIAVAYGRFAFANTFEGKNVPKELQAGLRAGFDRYDFNHHAQTEASNPNADVFADATHLVSYLIDRMTIVGTREHCRERLEELRTSTNIDAVNFVVIVPDPQSTVQLAAEAFSDLVDA